MEELIDKIIGWINKTDQRLVIGISGHGAAGKTTFANKLISRLNQKREVNYLNTDPYIVSSAIRKQCLIHYSYHNEPHHYKMTACHPAAHHLPSLERDVQMIRNGFDLCTIDTHYKNVQSIPIIRKVSFFLVKSELQLSKG